MTRRLPAQPVTRPDLVEQQWLRCVEPLVFWDVTLEPPAVVELLRPTELEQKGGRFSGGLAEDEKRDLDKRPPTRWVVIDWQGVRRRVPMRAFRRLP